MGLAVSAADNKRLREMPKHARELKRLNDLRVGFVDVREHIQRRIELAGGAVLFFGGSTPNDELPSWARVTLAGKEHLGIDLGAVDDLNAIFGNPTPGQTKLLSIDYVIVGHDAERKTEASESIVDVADPRRALALDERVAGAQDHRRGRRGRLCGTFIIDLVHATLLQQLFGAARGID